MPDSVTKHNEREVEVEITSIEKGKPSIEFTVTKRNSINAQEIMEHISKHLTDYPDHKITITLKDEVMDILCCCRGNFVK